MMQSRFNDQNKRITEFQTEVLVVCPSCGQKAKASVDYEKEKARLLCAQCSYNKENTTESTVLGISGHWRMAAHQYFSAKLWLQHPFKNEVFWAYNEQHLAYWKAILAPPYVSIKTGRTLHYWKSSLNFTMKPKTEQHS